VGVFVWRLQSYSVSAANLTSGETPPYSAYCVEDEGPQCYTFSVLSQDTQLFTRPEPETNPTHLASELNLPVPISRREFAEPVPPPPPQLPSSYNPSDPPPPQASGLYYGKNKSVLIWAPGWDGAEAGSGMVLAGSIIPTDLSGWKYTAPRNRILVDPELGRIKFPTGQLPPNGVWVSYQYGFSADIGGGEYNRPLSQPAGARLYRVESGATAPVFPTINAALQQWKQDKATLRANDPPGSKPTPVAAVIEIADSGVYTEQLSIVLEQNESLQIRAANRTRPVIRLLDYMAGSADALRISIKSGIIGPSGSRFTLDGLMVTGRPIRVSGPAPDVQISNPARVAQPNVSGSTTPAPTASGSTEPGDLCDVTIRHCTFVPGWALHCDCEPHRPGDASLELANTRAEIRIEHSILGGMEVTADEAAQDPVCIQISDSILDATDVDCDALVAPDCRLAYTYLTCRRTTVIGKVFTHAIKLAENTIFNGTVTVARRQIGCVRFCYVPSDSRTPRRYECQPDLVQAVIADELNESAKRSNLPTPAAGELQAAEDLEAQRVEPEFNSLRYGTPTYCQLAQTCAEEITTGADDESEMGVFHDLYQPQRAANLRARLDDFTPAGMDAGIIYVT
jgi:hypothetical protein